MALKPCVWEIQEGPLVILSVEEGMGSYPWASLRAPLSSGCSSLRIEIRTVQRMSERGRKERKERNSEWVCAGPCIHALNGGERLEQ